MRDSGAPLPVSPATGSSLHAIEVRGLTRRFGRFEALRGVSLDVAPGEIHAILGPNGAGKTTLMRVLSGLADPSAGSAQVLGRGVGRSRDVRGLIGLVPSGDRSFYERISALENLLFFARLRGLRAHEARARALAVLAAVGLEDTARQPVNTYSHGMQKRLSFARALLTEPPLLLVDEATHDLDPGAARQVRALATARAQGGTAILWATQRIEELPGFAERVTLLDRGSVRFSGSVMALVSVAGAQRHLLRLGRGGVVQLDELEPALDGGGRLEPSQDGDPEHAVLVLAPGVPLGAAISSLHAAGAQILSCRDESPPIERAFLALTGGRAA
jgi:ABC-2 type transport system ATP-binding protein